MSKIQVVKELHQPAGRNYPRRHTLIKGYSDLYQADLAKMQTYSRENKGYRYILVIINCYSKYLSRTEPVKNKTGREIADAMKRILSRSQQFALRNLQTHQGTEFYNTHFSKLMTKYGITKSIELLQHLLQEEGVHR